MTWHKVICSGSSSSLVCERHLKNNFSSVVSEARLFHLARPAFEAQSKSHIKLGEWRVQPLLWDAMTDRTMTDENFCYYHLLGVFYIQQDTSLYFQIPEKIKHLQWLLEFAYNPGEL